MRYCITDVDTVTARRDSHALSLHDALPIFEAKRLGYVIGSCSDRPIGFQRDLWERLRIAVDFTVLKHHLGDVRAQFAATAYYHRSEEHTSELQSRFDLVCRLLLEKKHKKTQ